jgi:hypothetical protein
VKWLLLDGIGSILVGIGLFLMIADPTQFLPWRVDYAEIGVGLTIVGVLFMLPLVMHLAGMARARAGGHSQDLTPPAP